MEVRYILALIIEGIGILTLITGLILLYRASPGITLTLVGAILIAVGSLLFFKIFRV